MSQDPTQAAELTDEFQIIEEKTGGRPLSPQELARWRQDVIQEAKRRAMTGCDLVLHGAAQGLIDEGIFSNIKAHKFIAKAMRQELEDHDL